MNQINLNKYIVANPSICHGKPTFKGTRVMIWQVLDMLREGLSLQEILQAFPSLKSRDVKAALSYATDLTRGENYVMLKV